MTDFRRTERRSQLRHAVLATFAVLAGLVCTGIAGSALVFVMGDAG